MVHVIVNQVVVQYDPLLSIDEVNILVEDEIKRWKEMNKELARVDLTLDGDCVVISAVEKSPIRRLRRITGYISNLDNFNDAKQDELRQRFKHM
mgnify:CR=1 FL=1